MPVRHSAHTMYRSRSGLTQAYVMAAGKTGGEGIDFVFAARRNLWDAAQERPHQQIQLGIGDQVSSLLAAQRSPKDARKAQYRAAPTSQTARSIVLAEQFTLHAKDRQLQAHKVHICCSKRTCHADYSSSGQCRGTLKINSIAIACK